MVRALKKIQRIAAKTRQEIITLLFIVFLKIDSSSYETLSVSLKVMISQDWLAIVLVGCSPQSFPEITWTDYGLKARLYFTYWILTVFLMDSKQRWSLEY
jgi:hypothetical protein